MRITQLKVGDVFGKVIGEQSVSPQHLSKLNGL